MQPVEEPLIIRFLTYLFQCLNNENEDDIIDEIRSLDFKDLNVI